MLYFHQYVKKRNIKHIWQSIPMFTTPPQGQEDSYMGKEKGLIQNTEWEKQILQHPGKCRWSHEIVTQHFLEKAIVLQFLCEWIWNLFFISKNKLVIPGLNVPFSFHFNIKDLGSLKAMNICLRWIPPTLVGQCNFPF